MIKMLQICIKDNIQDAFDGFYRPYLYHRILIYLIYNSVYFRGGEVILYNKRQ